MGYSTDLTDTEWAVLRPFFEREGPGRPPKHSVRDMINAIQYVLKTGCHWELLPNDFPPYKSVYSRYMRWRDSGQWEYIQRQLVRMVRKLEGRNPNPTAAIIDSQSVKTVRKKGV